MIARPQSPSAGEMPSKPGGAPGLTQPLTAEKALEEALKKQRASLEKQRQAIHRQLGEKEDKIDPPQLAVEHFIVPFLRKVNPIALPSHK